MQNAFEAMLLKWNSSAAGSTITLLLPDEKTLEPFKNMKSGRAYGQRLGVAFALIADDESTEEVKPVKRKWNELTAAQQAAMMCQDSLFWKFINEYSGQIIRTKDEAADYVREYCSVSSRSDLDKSSESLARWKELSTEFFSWKNEPSYDYEA